MVYGHNWRIYSEQIDLIVGAGVDKVLLVELLKKTWVGAYIRAWALNRDNTLFED